VKMHIEIETFRRVFRVEPCICANHTNSESSSRVVMNSLPVMTVESVPTALGTSNCRGREGDSVLPWQARRLRPLYSKSGSLNSELMR
jgi:hypothetical protein